MNRYVHVFAPLFLSISFAAQAQCSYQECALAILPRWNGLAVVEGVNQSPRANLNFFRPTNLGPVFSGDSARSYGARAVRVRTMAAALTDIGIILGGVVVARGVHARTLNTADRALAAAGAASFAVSLPLQFSADGLLSRAVWWHNAGVRP